MKIVLIGYMGCGKSSVGKNLAEQLGIPFMDLDIEIENEYQRSISEIFAEKGEIHFRKIENEILKRILEAPGNLVLATGGGTPCYGDAMHLLNQNENVVSIYLKASLKVLVDRLFQEMEQRPLISHLKTREDLTDFVRKHLFERAFYYNQANLIVDNEAGSKETVSNIIQKLF